MFVELILSFENTLARYGCRSGESARLPLMCPGSIPGPGVICGLSLVLVLYSALRGFSPGTPIFLEYKGISERVLVYSLVLLCKELIYLHTFF